MDRRLVRALAVWTVVATFIPVVEAGDWTVVGGDALLIIDGLGDANATDGLPVEGRVISVTVSDLSPSLPQRRTTVSVDADGAVTMGLLRFESELSAGDSNAADALLLDLAANSLVIKTPSGEGAWSTEHFELDDVRVALDRAGRALLIEADATLVSIGDAAESESATSALGASFQARLGVQPFAGSVVQDHPTGEVAGVIGPDVIVGELHNLNNYGTDGTLSAFSVGTTSCNRGDTPLSWIANNNQHPVIGQNMYRLRDGRFEQIGQSWLKHGFLALAENACGLGCQNPGTGALLGVGCSDPYSANLNGQQNNLAPKSEVNAATGFFPYPPSNPTWSGSMARRLQVHNSDLDPALDGGGLYFVEGQYVAADDAAAGNNHNNASYRRVTMSPNGGGGWNMLFASPTMRERAAIRAWRDNDPAVVETNVVVPNDGLLILAARATHLGNGLWQYEYAIQNLNSDRSAGSFSVPAPTSKNITDLGFHDVPYHSGEPYDGTDWPPVASDDQITWATPPHATNPNANALRWGTLYNFRFAVNAPPTSTTVTIGLFKPGTPDSVTVSTVGPAIAPTDCNLNGVFDDCDLDCSASGGSCNVPGCGESVDCDASGLPDECETDCNHNGVFDSCDLADGTSEDCNINAVPDECDADWDGDAVPDDCDDDIDGDGLVNASDVCDFTPLGATRRANGATVGDINNDCDVDLSDYSHFDECFAQSGPDHPPAQGACLGLYDAQSDSDIDLLDFAHMQRFFGP